MKTSIKIAALVLFAGCATTGAPVKNGLDDNDTASPQPARKVGGADNPKQAPPPQTTQEEAENKPPAANTTSTDNPAMMAQKAPPVKKVAATARKSFDAAFDKWEAAKKAGPIGQKSCSSLAEAFSDAAKEQDVAAQAHFNAGSILEDCGQDKDAEEEYQKALAANPKFAPAIANLGELAYKRKDVSGARQKFEAAIAADPRGAASAYNNLAVILFQEAREGNTSAYKDAISKLRRALAIDSDSMPAYALLALIYYTTSEGDRSKLQLAELVCKEANLSNDHFAPIYNTMGLIELRKKNVTGALKHFEKAVDLDPRYVEAHLNIGAIGLSSRQYEKAEKSFQVVLKLQPSNIDAVIGLGVAMRGQKKFDEAEAMYKKALELDPRNCAVPYNLGVLYQDYKNDPSNNNLKEAQKFYNQYLGCAKTNKRKADDAQRRIKDIDDTFAALEQQKKMEAELKAQQEEMERQQKEMEKQQQQQQQQAPQGEKDKK
jgi:tetratricopeptide (TPR) repeat protein